MSIGDGIASAADTLATLIVGLFLFCLFFGNPFGRDR